MSYEKDTEQNKRGFTTGTIQNTNPIPQDDTDKYEHGFISSTITNPNINDSNLKEPILTKEGLSVEICDEMIAVFLKAIKTVSTAGQYYQINQRRFDRANLKELQDALDYWFKKRAEVLNSTSKKSRYYRVQVRDF